MWEPLNRWGSWTTDSLRMLSTLNKLSDRNSEHYHEERAYKESDQCDHFNHLVSGSKYTAEITEEPLYRWGKWTAESLKMLNTLNKLSDRNSWHRNEERVYKEYDQCDHFNHLVSGSKYTAGITEEPLNRWGCWAHWAWLIWYNGDILYLEYHNGDRCINQSSES